MRNFGVNYKISKLYLMLLDVSFFMNDSKKPSTFEDIREKLKFWKQILYMFMPKAWPKVSGVKVAPRTHQKFQKKAIPP